MYNSAPAEREGENIEEVLPAAIYTTSSTGREIAPTRGKLARNGGRQLANQSRLVLGLVTLCAVLVVLLVIAIVL